MLGESRFPSLAAIRAFEAAARHRSFARAAQELATTAASVSYHVRRLEQQLGVALFRRDPHRVVLTEAGELVAQEAIAAFAALRASFTRAVELDESRLRLTTLPSLGTSWLTPRLGRYRARHPNVAVELDLSADAQDLGAGGFDAAIRNGHGRWPGLSTVPLLPSLFLPLCAPALLPALAGLADPSRGDVPLLGRPDWWHLWYRALGRPAGPPEQRFGTRLSAEYLDVAAAVAGHGVAIASPLLFGDELAAGRLVPAHELVASDGRAFWLACPSARRNSAKFVAFRDWLVAEAEQTAAAGRGFIARMVVVAA
ncbi:LysR substrate-binding domain-containing protein [Tahibacter caeni]|uniref:LysR substrate-binding domain-containing protein n=1 Tax=Tahibacter caeni TaxID=1453545 RepID=UPI002147D3CB|nr:LysR substrate-binding domain-containing protein [Tahibacter caeni]